MPSLNRIPNDPGTCMYVLHGVWSGALTMCRMFRDHVSAMRGGNSACEGKYVRGKHVRGKYVRGKHVRGEHGSESGQQCLWGLWGCAC